MLISLHSTCDGLFFFFNEAPECSLEACLNLQVLIFGLKASLVLKSEKAMAIHSSILAWKIPWMEEPGGLQSLGSQSRTQLSDFTFTFHFHALEKEMAIHSSVLAWRIPETGAWWAAIYGVAQSRIRLTWLSSSSSSPKIQLFPERTTWRGDVVLALFNNPHPPIILSYKIQLLAFIIFITVVNYIQFICGYWL